MNIEEEPRELRASELEAILNDVKRNTKIPKRGRFNIMGRQSLDSEGTDSWKRFLDMHSLAAAWDPPKGSPYNRCAKKRAIVSVELVKDRIQPRFSDREKTSKLGVANLIREGKTGPDTAIIINSGGAHSIAMALPFMRIGYQPVLMIDSVPDPIKEKYGKKELLDGCVNDMATLLYFASEVERMKNEGVVRNDSPPVFILDCHNYSNLSPDDFPSSQELKEYGINKIIHIDEANLGGQIMPGRESKISLPPIMPAGDWQENEIEIHYTGVSPEELHSPWGAR